MAKKNKGGSNKGAGNQNSTRPAADRTNCSPEKQNTQTQSQTRGKGI